MTQKFRVLARDWLNQAGFKEPVLIGEPKEEPGLDCGEVMFEVGTILLRFVRDRRQDFLDVGWVSAPTRFYQFDDLQIAMGWKSISEVVGKTEPEPVADVLRQIFATFSQLEAAVAPEREEETRGLLSQASTGRSAAPR